VIEMDCIFCKIVKGEMPCHKIYEDKEFLAILDISPNTKGVTLVLTKKHYPSYAFDIPEEVYTKLMLFTKKVAKMLDKALDVKRTTMVMEGLGIDHAHIKLYPVHGLKEKFEEIWAPEKIFFENYKGYITTQLGPRADDKELEELAKKIRESF
jgi:diadenosine tetraphosphate (Ap4A) HIT family hydrolase